MIGACAVPAEAGDAHVYAVDIYNSGFSTVAVAAELYISRICRIKPRGSFEALATLEQVRVCC